ncbi:MAG: hypothetical protein Q8O83_01075 [bacterium]|nr:hypothetical protein [bacterium]
MKSSTKSIEVSIEEMGALAGYTVQCLVQVSPEQIAYWLSHKKEYKEHLLVSFAIADEYFEERQQFSKFYKKHLNWDVDFSKVAIPLKPSEGLWVLLFIAKGLTPNKMYDAWSFSKWRYTSDLDASVPTNTRTAGESYAIWVLDSIEPDKEFLGKPVTVADPNMDIGMTLLERMVFGQWYFDQTGKHLDAKGATKCSASRSVDGSVPRVLWDSDYEEVFVFWYSVDSLSPRYGVRLVVS